MNGHGGVEQPKRGMASPSLIGGRRDSDAPTTACPATTMPSKPRFITKYSSQLVPRSKKQAPTPPFALFSTQPSIPSHPIGHSHPPAWARCAAATRRRRRPGSTSWGCSSPPSSPSSSCSSALRPGGAASPSTPAADCSLLTPPRSATAHCLGS